MVDREIVAGLIEGREDAAEAFVLAFRPRVIWVLRKQGVPDAECEDVAQDVLFTAWRQLTAGRFQGRSELFSWLYTIILGKAADYRRRQVKDKSALVPAEPESRGGSEIAARGADQEARVLMKEALQRMSLRPRCVLVLHFRDNLHVDTIAKILKVRTKTVRNLLSEAKREFTDLVLGRGTESSPRRLTGESDD